MNFGFSALKLWLNSGLSFLYPEICQLCGQERAKPEEGFVCGNCQARVQFITRPFCERCGLPVEGQVTGAYECANCQDMKLYFTCARSAVTTRQPQLEAIHKYKYNRALWLEPFLAALLVRAAAPSLEAGKWELIVPVPLHRKKQREREFNQAERLARRLSRATGIPLASRLMRRILP